MYSRCEITLYSKVCPETYPSSGNVQSEDKLRYYNEPFVLILIENWNNNLTTPFFVFDFKSSLTDPNPKNRTSHKFT